MTTLAEFDGLRLRPTDTFADLERLEDWVKVDDAHRDSISPHHFMTGPLGIDPRPGCYALEDANGVVFYIRIARAARVHIQFPPDDSGNRLRVAKGLVKGMAFLETQLAQAGCEEWIFDTQSEGLRSMAIKTLGFHESKDEMVRGIAQPASTISPVYH